MGRDVRGHTDGNTGRTVDQQVREPGGQYHRLFLVLVEVGLEIDRVLIDVGNHFQRDLRQSRFGITHGRGRVVVAGTEVAVAVHQHRAHREILRQPHQRVVYRRVAVGVVFTHDHTDRRRALSIRFVRRVPFLEHRVDDPPGHRLQTVPYIRDRAVHDNAHSILYERLFHLFFYISGYDFVLYAKRLGVLVFFLFDHRSGLLKTALVLGLPVPPRYPVRRNVLPVDYTIFQRRVQPIFALKNALVSKKPLCMPFLALRPRFSTYGRNQMHF